MKVFFRKIIKDTKNYITLAKKLKDDKRVPKASKILLALAIGYFLLPIDLIPDFIPIIGHLDDLIIIPTLIFIAIKLIPKEVFDENYRQIFGD
ncbi:MAG: hypothetical protein A2Y12_19000 [Planctomycetes bacterium GWF2_42_9]|nr:MAG: hypothetical protein A2Y12_19000 [Planctomycetes bacterium GWF2_42_9]HAL44460.1 hypothetical protein [Phycisphaerales bacterium]